MSQTVNNSFLKFYQKICYSYGWMELFVNLLSGFVCYVFKKQKMVMVKLIGFSSSESELTQNAENHVEFLKYLLSLLKKSVDDVVDLIRDDCSTNQRMAWLLNKEFAGCYRHRFNLAVEEMTVSESKMIPDTRKFIERFSNPIPGSKLMSHTKI